MAYYLSLSEAEPKRLRLSTLVLLYLLLQNRIFHPTHSYSLLHIHYSRISIPSYLSFMAHTKFFNTLPPPASSSRAPHRPTPALSLLGLPAGEEAEAQQGRPRASPPPLRRGEPHQPASSSVGTRAASPTVRRRQPRGAARRRGGAPAPSSRGGAPGSRAPPRAAGGGELQAASRAAQSSSSSSRHGGPPPARRTCSGGPARAATTAS
jgi:hypothetical protein